MQGKIAVGVTSAGIVKTLLQNSKTVQATFKIFFEIAELETQESPFFNTLKHWLKCLMKLLLLYEINQPG